MIVSKSKKLLLLGLACMLAAFFSACGDDLSNIYEIQCYTSIATIDLEKEKNTTYEITVNVRSHADNVLPEYLQYVSNDPSIATIEYVSHEEGGSLDKLKVKAKITGVASGETICYVQTTDGKVKSDDITVKVTGDPNVLKINEYGGKPLADVIAKMDELGYTAKYTHASSNLDFTSEIQAYSEADLSKWLIVSVKNVDSKNKTAEFTINTQENIDKIDKEEKTRSALEAKIDSATACQAVENYGKEEYPYGFTLHYIMGAYSKTPVDENTWFIKCDATIVNAFNAKQKVVCEANVSGTKESPVVTDFRVY